MKSIAMNDDLIGDAGGTPVPLEEGAHAEAQRRRGGLIEAGGPPVLQLLLGWTKPTVADYVPRDCQRPCIQDNLFLFNFAEGDDVLCGGVVEDGDWPQGAGLKRTRSGVATLSVGGDWPDGDWEDNHAAFESWDTTRTLIEARTKEEWRTAYAAARALLRHDHINVDLNGGGCWLSVKQLGRGKSITLLAK